MAANQFYGPSGVGALYVRTGVKIAPLLDGGIQENGLRAGTQNMIGIVGMGKAAQLASKRDVRQDGAPSEPEKEVHRADRGDRRDPHQRPSGKKPSPPRLVLGAVRRGGIDGPACSTKRASASSTRSACATGSLRASHVLTSIGRDYASTQGTLIFSFGIQNTRDDVDASAAAFRRAVDFLRSMSPLYQKK